MSENKFAATAAELVASRMSRRQVIGRTAAVAMLGAAAYKNLDPLVGTATAGEGNDGAPGITPDAGAQGGWRGQRSRSLYDKDVIKKALLSSQSTLYGAKLNSPNVASADAVTADDRVSLVFLDAAKAERLEIEHMVNALLPSPAMLVGTFPRPDDPELKPKLDAGLQGAVLERARSLADVLAFLRRLYLPSQGGPHFPNEGGRPVGPAKANRRLDRLDEEVARANAMILSGVTIADAAGAANIQEIAKAKNHGLNFLYLDRRALATDLGAEGSQFRALVADVESAAMQAGLPLAGLATSQGEAQELLSRGYRILVIGDDLDAIRAGFARFGVEPGTGQPLPLRPEIEPEPSDNQTLAGAASADNPLRRWIDAGKVVNLGFLMTPDLVLAREIAARTNALWIDAEHGPFSLRSIRALVRGLPSGTNVVIRAASSDHPDIPEYVKLGAKAVVAPMIRSQAEARAFGSLVHAMNPQTLAVVMVETREALQAVQAIAQDPEVEIVHQGPYDLKMALGVPWDSEPHRNALKAIEAATVAAGKPIGGLAGSRSELYRKQSLGYRFVTTVSDQEALTSFFKGWFS